MKRTICIGMLAEATGISMAKIIEPRMSLAFKKDNDCHSHTFSKKMPQVSISVSNTSTRLIANAILPFDDVR